MSTNNPVFRVLLGSCFVTAVLLLQTSASAETLTIQYTGLDISYDGSEITTVGGDDPLNAVDFLVDGVLVLGLSTPEDAPLAIDINIPGVSGLPVGGGTVTSAAGGSLSLTLPSGDFLNLELAEADVVYVAIDSVELHFALAAGSAELLGQLLPIDGFAGDVAVSFSTQIDKASLKNNGTSLTKFVAAGTGEIAGIQVPEPTSAALLVGGLLVCLAGVRRHG